MIASGAAPSHAVGLTVSRDLYTIVQDSPCDFGIRHFWVNDVHDDGFDTICLNCLETFVGLQNRLLNRK